MRTKNPESSTQAAMRKIFAERRPYAVVEAAALIGLEVATLDRQIEAGELETENDQSSLPWREVAYLALRQWPLKTIFDVLGTEASSLLPALLRPVEFSAPLPAYQVRMLEVLARRERRDAGTFLQGHLLDLASGEDHALLEKEIPGFLEALFFPFGGER